MSNFSIDQLKASQTLNRFNLFPLRSNWKGDFTKVDWLNHLSREIGRDPIFDLYLHIPFCKQLCHFCGLNVKITKRNEEVKRYIETLKEEWKLYKPYLSHGHLNTIYVGGGTPNFLKASELENLLSFFLKENTTAEKKNIIVELDPRYISDDHISMLKNLPIHTLILGIQDLDPRVMSYVNRFYPEETLLKLLSKLKIKLDIHLHLEFMFNLPFQTETSLARNLNKITPYEPSFISIYPYIPPPWLSKYQHFIGKKELSKKSTKENIYNECKEFLDFHNYKDLGLQLFVLKNTSLYSDFKEGNFKHSIMGVHSLYANNLIGLGVSSLSKTQSMLAQNHTILQNYEDSITIKKIEPLGMHNLSEREQLIKHFFDLMITTHKINLSTIKDILEEKILLKLKSALKVLTKQNIIRAEDENNYIINSKEGHYLQKILTLFSKI
jgi:oxygen-independent coproporphyrinogen-3 oxidase